MICIYESTCTDFSTNGLGVVCPQSCTVTETLNGEYEVTLIHPIDEDGKWERLTSGRILRVPVPASMTPKVKMKAQEGSTGTQIYKIDTSSGTTPGGTLRLRAKPSTSGKVLASYKNGSEVVIVEKTNSTWYEVTAPDGKRGYMMTAYLVYDRTEGAIDAAAAQVVAARQLRDQPFRIYRVVPDLDKVTVYARHVFYDLMDNMVKSLKPAAKTTGSAAFQALSSACLTSHDFTFYSNLTSKSKDVEIINMNPVDAILGDDGLVEKYGGELCRDWWDVFLVNRVGKDTDVQIRQGKNLTGISYDVDETDVVTRIMPTGEDKDGEILYLPETYIDSDQIGSYPTIKWYHLEVSDAKESDDEDDPKTKSQCYTEMRAAAQELLDADCDLPTVTLSVSFINCADTVEYQQYKPLQNIYLGDAVRVIAGKIGVAVSMRMTQYTYDCLTEKYTDMVLGTAADTLEGNTISRGQIGTGLITGAKLAFNSVGTGSLQSGSVGSLQIRNAAIETAHIQDACITNAKIADATIGSAKIADAAIGTAKIEDAAITTAKIGDAAITTAKIGDAAITSAKIENGTITSADIGEAQILSANIQDGAITHAKIGTAAVQEANIEDASITSAKIATAAITNAKIAGAAIGEANIQDASISTAKIVDGAITRAKIAELVVDTALIQDLAVTTAKIAQASVTNAKIANAAVDTAQIALGAITSALIENGAVGTAQIADASITDAKVVSLSANSITAGTLAVERLIIHGSDKSIVYAINNMGELTSTQTDSIDGYVLTERTITADKIIANAITANEIASKTITANEILAGTITAAEIAAATITGAKIAAGTITTSNVSSDFGTTLDLSSNTGLNLTVQQKVEAAVATSCELIVGTQTTGTASWTGVAGFSELKDGQQIRYWLPTAPGSTSVTLTLTLSDGSTTEAIPCYYGATTRLTTQYGAGNVIYMTYHENAAYYSSTIAKGWWANANYNSDTYDRIKVSGTVTIKTATSASRLMVSDGTGYAALAASTAFDLSQPILWLTTTSAAGSTSNCYLSYPLCTLRNNKSGYSGTKGATCYLVGTVVDKTFTPTSDLFTETVPTEEDGLTYIALGLMVNTLQITLYPEHPMYMFVDGEFRNLNQVAYEAKEIADGAAEASVQNAASINVLQGSIASKVSQTTYDDNQQAVESRLSTIEQTASDFKVSITKEVADKVAGVSENVDSLSKNVADFKDTVTGYMDFNGDSLSIGVTGSSFKTEITNTDMSFKENGQKVAYISNSDMYITRARVTDTLSVGTVTNGYFDFVTLSGGLALKWRTGSNT